MREVRKCDFYVTAFELGCGLDIEEDLINKGLIVRHEDYYEVRSRECKGKGEVAHVGDFVKIDHSNNPYPNNRARFLSHHKKVGKNQYCQYREIIWSWQYGDAKNDVIEHLLDSDKLTINEDSYDSFYEADIWGTTLSAKKIDIILIYSVDRDGDRIISVDFNLIAKEEFDKTYKYV